MQVLVKRRFNAFGERMALARAQAIGPADLDHPVSGTVYGVVLNGRQNLADAVETLSAPPYQKPPHAPVLYIKTPNTFRPHGASVPAPAHAEHLQLDGALAVVFGRTATRVREAEALDFVAGCSAAVDLYLPHPNLFRPAVPHRCRDGFLPIGPWIVERASVGDVGSLEVVTSVNGQEQARFSTADLVRPIPRLIADITDFMTFGEGDVLLVTASPSGVRAAVGDRVSVEVAGVVRVDCLLEAERGEGDRQ